jgi:long-chain acyl-CoA synthetase
MLVGKLLSMDANRRGIAERSYDHSPAMLTEAGVWSLNRLVEDAGHVAAGLAAAGVTSGDRVALHMGNGPAIAIAYLACFQLGAIAAPLNLRFKQFELEDIVSRLQPKAYIGDAHRLEPLASYLERNVAPSRRFVVGETNLVQAVPWASLLEHEPLAPSADVDRHAPAVLLNTSGTTGSPKFVAHSQSTLLEGASRLHALDERDRLAFFLPMVHASGLFIFIAALLTGTLLVMVDATDPEKILDSVEKYRCTTLYTFPLIVAQLISCQKARNRDLSSMRLCATGGDACHPHIRDAFEGTVGIPLRSVWASTEGIGSLAISHGADPAYGPVPGVETRLVDYEGNPVDRGETGQLMIRGPQVALGYWEASRITSFPDGWYPTGDAMRQNEDGHYKFVSRLKDLIIRAGSNISPVEVEQVILSHSEVVDAGVVGVPDTELGQRVVGFVQLSAGASTDRLDDILRFVRGRLADYKAPDRLISLPQIPRNALGKVDRSSLLRMLRQAAPMAGEL